MTAWPKSLWTLTVRKNSSAKCKRLFLDKRWVFCAKALSIKTDWELKFFKKKHKSWCSCWQRGGLDGQSETVQGSTFSFAFVLIRLSCLNLIPNCFITRRTNLSHRRVYKRCTGNFSLHSFSSSCSELVSPRHWQQIGKTRLVAFFFVRYFLM